MRGHWNDSRVKTGAPGLKNAAFAILICASLGLPRPVRAEGPLTVSASTSRVASSDSSARVAQPRSIGSASCAAANCHGGADRGRFSHGDPWSPVAYNMWIASDPHAGAYATLLSDESRAMVKKLGLGDAHLEPTCLACHGPTATPDRVPASPPTTHVEKMKDGVDCESCHGAAERWLDPHKTDSWRFMSAAEKANYGFRDLDNLAERTQRCAECHVGSQGLDVNHDLIAAGHPRLLFEMSSLHARLPKHWRDEVEPIETLDAKLWTVGSQAAQTATLALLESRAANRDAAWPEFAEYDCFACHHTLADSDLRRDLAANRPSGRLGSLRWREPDYAELGDPFADNPSTDNQDNPRAALRREMSRPIPNRDRVVELAKKARETAAADAASLLSEPLDRARIHAYIRQLSSASDQTPVTWEAASQRYLGLAALHYSSVASSGNQVSPPGSTARERLDRLRSLQQLLSFSAASDEGRYNGPQDWSRERQTAIVGELRAIHDTVKQP